MGGRGRAVLASLVALAAAAACAPAPAERAPAAVSMGQPTRTLDVRYPDPLFVPQGLALADDGTAFVSGYHHAPMGERTCGLLRVDLSTGRVVEHAADLGGCRHAGGVARSDAGLWIAGARRVWLVDAQSLTVRRSWEVLGDIKASTVTSDGDSLVVGVFRLQGHARLFRFPYAGLLDPATTTIHPDDAAQVRRIPDWIQGIAPGPGGLWLTRSASRWGQLVTPQGERLETVAGAEGIAFDRQGGLWLLSESGSKPYQDLGGRPDVPTLTRFAQPTSPST
jgi:hypothetical protein